MNVFGFLAKILVFNELLHPENERKELCCNNTKLQSDALEPGREQDLLYT